MWKRYLRHHVKRCNHRFVQREQSYKCCLCSHSLWVSRQAWWKFLLWRITLAPNLWRVVSRLSAKYKNKKNYPIVKKNVSGSWRTTWRRRWTRSRPWRRWSGTWRTPSGTKTLLTRWLQGISSFWELKTWTCGSVFSPLIWPLKQPLTQPPHCQGLVAMRFID